MKEIPQHPPANEYSHLNIIVYFRPDCIRLDLPFILTRDKKLTIGMPYLYSEGNHSSAIRLLNVWDEGGIVYLQVQNLATTRTYTISWNLDYNGEFWLWSLADFDYLMNLPKKRGDNCLAAYPCAKGNGSTASRS